MGRQASRRPGCSVPHCLREAIVRLEGLLVLAVRLGNCVETMSTKASRASTCLTGALSAIPRRSQDTAEA
jgi:hypothetical protein